MLVAIRFDMPLLHPCTEDGTCILGGVEWDPEEFLEYILGFYSIEAGEYWKGDFGCRGGQEFQGPP